MRGRLKTRTVDSGAGGTPAVTEFTYDLAGTLTGMTLPDGSTLTYEYDPADRLVAIQNDLGERIEYGYDDMSNRTAQTVKDASLTIVRQATATFDDLGRMLKSIGAYAGEETTYAYNGVGHALLRYRRRNALTPISISPICDCSRRRQPRAELRL